MPVTQTNNSETVKDLLWPKHRTQTSIEFGYDFVPQICETFRRAGFRDCYLSLLDDRRYVERFFFLFSLETKSKNSKKRKGTSSNFHRVEFILLYLDSIRSFQFTLNTWHNHYFWNNFLTFSFRKKRERTRTIWRKRRSLICAGVEVPRVVRNETSDCRDAD